MRAMIAGVMVSAVTVMLVASGSAFGQGGGGTPTFPGDGTKAPGRGREGAPRPDRAAAPAEVDLRPRFEAGQSIRYTLVVRGDNSITMPDALGEEDLTKPPGGGGGSGPGGSKTKTVPQTMEQTIDFTIRVKSSDAEKGSVIELEYDRLAMRMKTGEDELSADTAKGGAPGPAAPGKPGGPGGGGGGGAGGGGGGGSRDPNQPLLDMLRGMQGTKFTIELDAAGNIKKVDGGSSAVPRVPVVPGGGGGLGGLAGGLGGLGGGVPVAPSPQQIAESLFGPVSARSGQPARARVGDRWETQTATSVGPLGKLAIRTVHRLSGVRGRTADVALTGTVTPESLGDDPIAAAMGLKLKSSSYQGRYSVDTTTGHLESANVEMSTAISGQLGGQPLELAGNEVMTVKRR